MCVFESDRGYSLHFLLFTWIEKPVTRGPRRRRHCKTTATKSRVLLNYMCAIRDATCQANKQAIAPCFQFFAWMVGECDSRCVHPHQPPPPRKGKGKGAKRHGGKRTLGGIAKKKIPCDLPPVRSVPPDTSQALTSTATPGRPALSQGRR